jgi:hypothetical protein
MAALRMMRKKKRKSQKIQKKPSKMLKDNQERGQDERLNWKDHKRLERLQTLLF